MHIIFLIARYNGYALEPIESLKAYVLQRAGRPDIYFFGIFEKNQGLHIGNIKYEPVLPNLATATMGVLIGDSNFRGVGVFNEVFIASARWLNKECGIKSINLGVDLQNYSALKSYQKAGFKIEQIRGKNKAIMVCNL